jgi:dCMP deaminase
MADWNKRYLAVAKLVASWSKDRNRKVGAVIVNVDNRIVATGYNGFPSGINDNIDARHERPAKYLFTEHAERNAMYSAANHGIPLKNCKIILEWYPCADCARGIIQVGITKLVCGRPDFTDERWGDSFIAAAVMLKEANIEIEYL